MYSSVIGNISCIRNALSRLSSNLTIWRISQDFPAFSFFSKICLYLSMRLDNGIIQYIPVFVSSKTVIMRSVSRFISLEIRIGHIYKEFVLDNIKACFLHLPVLTTEKSSALRRRTILSTQPFIYRILVSGKLSTRPFIYHISVSGKLSLYVHSSKHKEESQ